MATLLLTKLRPAASLFFVLLLLFSTISCYSQLSPSQGVIPVPLSIKVQPGNFRLSQETHITWSNEEDATTAAIFNEQLVKYFSFTAPLLKGSNNEPNLIRLQRVFTDDLPPDGYKIFIDDQQVTISAVNGAGIFYGVQTLLQLIPVTPSNPRLLSQLSITDYPRYKWRGMHLDAARHFFSKDEVKQYIDYLAAYKFNTFHWHLTDDQGWRIEIKKYPKLTETGAWRNGTLIGHYSNHPEFDTIRYGGYYSQDDIREVVAYAHQRFINIVPEIEMPGHSLAALAAYPELSCKNGPFEVGKTWGVYNDVMCPTEETIVFMQNVLREVMDLFPSPYIHIGGDECPKEQWKESVACQKMMQQLGLKDEAALQSYFTGRIEKFVNESGRKIIGWDEILEGGLSVNAAVMSWRGMQGGFEAASNRHEVVMTPTDFCYFDYYQSKNSKEPLAIGGFIPLEKVYAFEPTPSLLSLENQQYILGGQANVWTEYIPSFSQLQYMIFPRMCAMSEVLWSKKEIRNYKDFTMRLSANHFPRFNAMHINYSKALLEVKMEVRDNDNGEGVIVRLATNDPANTINYNLSSYENEMLSATNNTRFETGPLDLLINHSVLLNMVAKDIGGTKGPESVQSFEVNLATGKKLTLTDEADPKYNSGGAFTLVNGITGRIPWNGSEWLGFSGKNLDVMIDLEKSQFISKVTVGVLDDEGSWIYLPKQVTVSVSTDGKNFKVIAVKNNDAIKKAGGRKISFSFSKTSVRYVKVTAINYGTIPPGKAGAGNPAWLFADEISVN